MVATRASTPAFVRYAALPIVLLLVITAHGFILGSSFASAPTRELAAYAMSGLALALCLLACEVCYPLEEYTVTPRQRRTDIAYNVVMGIVFGFGHVLASRVPALWEIVDFAFDLSEWPILLQLIIGVAAHDLLLYWWHRTLHESGNDFLWKLHEPHHAPRRFSFLSGARGHVLDLSFLLVVLAITYMVLGVSHAVRPWIFLYPVMAGAVHHANVDFRLGPFNWIFLGPELHRAHHATNLRDGLSCYASCFPLWDLVFGTARPRRKGGETIYGLSYDYDDSASFGEALVRPFNLEDSTAVNTRPSRQIFDS